MLVARQCAAAALAIGMVLTAWSTCAGGAMTMSKMVCCVDHHGDCPMADMGESCCGSDEDAGIGMLKPERADDSVAPSLHHASLPQAPDVFTPTLLAVGGAEWGFALGAVRHSPLTDTVLLI
jgi:hypothetical protein